ncbi:hypothetical protein Q672_07010 [Marinobacter sp. EVN1]|uniref:YezD family protein n=1 Tax=Marinobacter sp. EVN1 TaxID=1397532 RepID=UPI0003B91A9D|nr:YezD family protein [Marinobacter sp. EVN1]ERS81057.1 hypothetical protein Q672_07010 [Marinobacter sp. EVN1]
MSDSNPRLVQELSSLIESLIGKMDFGTVELTFHQGQLVQLEKREKVRFEKSTGAR